MAYDPWRVAAGRAGESAQSVTHAGRAFMIVYRRRRVLAARSRPVTRLSGGSGRQNARGEFPHAVVRIECERCGRAESYRKDGLVARFGANMPFR